MDIAGIALTVRPLESSYERLIALRSTSPLVEPTDLLDDQAPIPPPPWRRVSHEVAVPDGDLEAVRAHVLGYDVLRYAGVGVLGDTAGAVDGATVLQRLPRSGPGVLAPCRIVTVLDEPDAVGFLYAALPGHPLAGEEAFVGRRLGDGTVVCRVTSRSRPDAALAERTGPLLTAFQRWAARRYVAGMVAAARHARP